MKQFFLSLFIGSAVLSVGCNSNDAKTADKTKSEDTTVKTTVPVTAQDKEAKATADLCNCMNTSLADMSPKVREIIVAAAKSNNPMQVLTTELQTVKGQAEQEQLVKEFQKFENNQQMQACTDDIKKRYNLDGGDRESANRMLKAAEQNKDCELVHALMKIGLQQQPTVDSTQK